MPESPSPPIEMLVEDLLRATGQLLRRLRSEAGAGGLSWSQAVTLSRLQKEGAATTADLARAEGVKPQSMGATMAALENEGLVQRRPHPTDGRQALYSLTASGMDTLAQRRLLKREWLTAAMKGLDEQEKQALATALHVIDRLGSA